MRAISKPLLLLLTIGVVALLPMPGAVLRWGWPLPGWGVFPVSSAGMPKPPFELWVFVGGLCVGLLLLAPVLFPRWFGFQAPVPPRRRCHSVPLPWWFWVGAAVNVASWRMMWFGELPLAAYSFVPLWWGFIVALDGYVYRRAGGRSLLASAPGRLLAITAVSVPAWAFFEFLNYYAIEFWVYPNNQIFSPHAQAAWYLLSFSTVWPAVFEWYTLLHTFDGLWNRWAHGPKIKLATPIAWGLLAAGAVLQALFGAFPFQLFVSLWIGAPLIMTSVLALLGFWTPFRPIRHGNWSPVVLIGLAALGNGVLWELWNFGSKYFHPSAPPTNPNYWYYDIPYVNVVHLFSEMPLLGYFGYLPFGALAWVFWLVIAHTFRLDPIFDLTCVAKEPIAEMEPHWHTSR